MSFLIHDRWSWRELHTRTGHIDGLGLANFASIKRGKLYFRKPKDVLKFLEDYRNGIRTIVKPGKTIPYVRSLPAKDVPRFRTTSIQTVETTEASIQTCPTPWASPLTNDNVQGNNLESDDLIALRGEESKEVEQNISMHGLQVPSPVQSASRKPQAVKSRVTKMKRKISKPKNYTAKTQKTPAMDVLISEKDIDLIRSYYMKDKNFDLLKFDEGGNYQTQCLVSLTPLVVVERCPRIKRMLQRDRDDKIRQKDFVTHLGLQSAIDKCATQHYRMRKRKRFSSYNDTASETDVSINHHKGVKSSTKTEAADEAEDSTDSENEGTKVSKRGDKLAPRKAPARITRSNSSRNPEEVSDADSLRVHQSRPVWKKKDSTDSENEGTKASKRGDKLAPRNAPARITRSNSSRNPEEVSDADSLRVHQSRPVLKKKPHKPTLATSNAESDNESATEVVDLTLSCSNNNSDEEIGKRVNKLTRNKRIRKRNTNGQFLKTVHSSTPKKQEQKSNLKMVDSKLITNSNKNSNDRNTKKNNTNTVKSTIHRRRESVKDKSKNLDQPDSSDELNETNEPKITKNKKKAENSVRSVTRTPKTKLNRLVNNDKDVDKHTENKSRNLDDKNNNVSDDEIVDNNTNRPLTTSAKFKTVSKESNTKSLNEKSKGNKAAEKKDTTTKILHNSENNTQEVKKKQITRKINSINRRLSASSSTYRVEYSNLEDHAIVTWVSLGGRARLVNGNRIWQELSDEYHNITKQSRSWHSLRNRYLRSILPKLETMALDPVQVRRLRAAAATGDIKSKLPYRRNSIFGAPTRGALSRRVRRSSSSEDQVPPKRRKLDAGSKPTLPLPVPRKDLASPEKRDHTPRYSEITKRFANHRHESDSSTPASRQTSPGKENASNISPALRRSARKSLDKKASRNVIESPNKVPSPPRMSLRNRSESPELAKTYRMSLRDKFEESKTKQYSIKTRRMSLKEASDRSQSPILAKKSPNDNSPVATTSKQKTPENTKHTRSWSIKFDQENSPVATMSRQMSPESATESRRRSVVAKPVEIESKRDSVKDNSYENSYKRFIRSREAQKSPVLDNLEATKSRKNRKLYNPKVLN